ncbi:MAG: sodium-independent anion transporter [Bacteroidota bacterium]
MPDQSPWPSACFASRFQDLINALPEIEVIIICMNCIPYVDQSGLYAMEDAILDMQAQGIKVIFTDVHGQPRDLFERFDLIPSW